MMTSHPRTLRTDPAATLAARLERYARRMSPIEQRILEAMIVMAMDPLDRQSHLRKPVLSADEAAQVAALRRDD